LPAVVVGRELLKLWLKLKLKLLWEEGCGFDGRKDGGGTEPQQPRDRDSLYHGGLAVPIAGGFL
jgi:hypothetical protein